MSLPGRPCSFPFVYRGINNSVSGNTDILVHGVQVAANAKSTKIRKAESLGVTVLDETAYLALISDDAVAAPEGD